MLEIKIFCLKFFRKLSKACLKYQEWKVKHNSEHKPWNNLMRIPLLDPRDIIAFDFAGLRKTDDDESQINEVAHQ